ncbi:MAG: complex I NDUFA9 subunit family protein, partial [Pseudomonadota bacterium]
VIERKRRLFKLPFWIAKLQGRAFDLIPTLTFGALANGVLTLDQVQMLQSDNVVSEGKDGMAALGLTPTAVEDVIPSYLAAYRP